MFELELATVVNESVRYFVPAIVDAVSLGAMAREAFSDTFAHLYDAAPFSRFLEQAYGPGGDMERDLADPEIHWLVAASGPKPIGYAKLSRLTAPAPAPQPGAMELRQIYVLRSWHGHGVADRLMEWTLNTARAKRATEIYLAVFNHNERAKRFYARHGFVEVGSCSFVLGDRVDDDRVWRRPL